MPNILINHLYLNLKSFESPNSTVTTEAISKPMFPSRVLGNIGAPLHTILDDLDMEDELEREGEIEEVARNIRDGDDEWRGTAGRSDNRSLIPVVSGLLSVHPTYNIYWSSLAASESPLIFLDLRRRRSRPFAG